MPRSLRVAQKHVDRVKKALLPNGFPRQQDLAEALEISRDTVSKFVNGKFVGYLNFIEICRVLALDWQEIADFGASQDAPPAARLDSLPQRLERLTGFAGLSDESFTPPDSEPLPHPKHSLLYDLVIQLNFKKEIELVQQVIDEYKTAGFLVRGNDLCGQKVCKFCVDRLLRLKDGWHNTRPISIDLNVNFLSRDPSNLWSILAKKFRLQDPDPKNILKTVCEHLPKQDIIFIFYGVDDMVVGGLLSAWIQEFWAPLVKMTKDMSARETHLLMFLVAESSSIIDLEVSVAYKFDQPEYPHLPLLLPLADKFEKKDLEEWIFQVRCHQDLVRPGLTVDNLLKRSKGIPKTVYQEIYLHYGIPW